MMALKKQTCPQKSVCENLNKQSERNCSLFVCCWVFRVDVNKQRCIFLFQNFLEEYSSDDFDREYLIENINLNCFCFTISQIRYISRKGGTLNIA